MATMTPKEYTIGRTAFIMLTFGKHELDSLCTLYHNCSIDAENLDVRGYIQSLPLREVKVLLECIEVYYLKLWDATPQERQADLHRYLDVDPWDAIREQAKGVKP